LQTVREADMSKSGFFAVDRRSWKAACDLGINEAVSLLIIAGGTGGDQRTSSWSATAVEKYTGMHHRRATAAIDALLGAGLLTVEKRGKLRRYFIKPASDVPSIITSIAKPATQSKDRFQAKLDELLNPEWIWLPKTLIEGAAGETPPVKMLRQSQDLVALRLFIDLYYFHDLAGSGGVEWRRGIGIRKLYIRTEIAQHGIYKVWGFKPDPKADAQTFENVPFFSPGIWQAWDLLIGAGLIEFVAHLVEGDTEDAEIIHPLPWGNGESGELAISKAALDAGRLMAPFFTDTSIMLAPVSKVRPHVQLIGIARMKYRPPTARTAEWLSNSTEWHKTAVAFEELARSVQSSGIKVVSR
jgi:DNA-binding transcriptional ArsR family regulator